jgi:hypothetical protein
MVVTIIIPSRDLPISLNRSMTLKMQDHQFDLNFEYANESDPRALEQFAQLVTALKALPSQVTVIAFSPPYAPQLYDQMEASGEFPHFDEVRRTLRDTKMIGSGTSIFQAEILLT